MLSTEFHQVYLSKREKEIAIKIAQGYTIQEIAQQLHISHHTILTHKKNIYTKTGITALAQVGVYVERMGWMIDTSLVIKPSHP